MTLTTVHAHQSRIIRVCGRAHRWSGASGPPLSSWPPGAKDRYMGTLPKAPRRFHGPSAQLAQVVLWPLGHGPDHTAPPAAAAARDHRPAVSQGTLLTASSPYLQVPANEVRRHKAVQLVLWVGDRPDVSLAHALPWAAPEPGSPPGPWGRPPQQQLTGTTAQPPPAQGRPQGSRTCVPVCVDGTPHPEDSRAPLPWDAPHPVVTRAPEHPAAQGSAGDSSTWNPGPTPPSGRSSPRRCGRGPSCCLRRR